MCRRACVCSALNIYPTLFEHLFIKCGQCVVKQLFLLIHLPTDVSVRQVLFRLRFVLYRIRDV